MKFPSAAKGIKKIFTSEILYLLYSVFMGAALTIAGVILAEDREADDTIGIILIVLTAVGGVLAVTGLILRIIGVVQTSRDEPSFRFVVFLAIFTLCVYGFAAFFPSDQLVSSIANVVSSAVSVVSNILIILGICNLAKQCDNQKVMEKGFKILRIVLCLAVLSIIANFISIFLPKNIGDATDSAKAFIIALGIFAVVLLITEYILYISFLGKAKKMLN